MAAQPMLRLSHVSAQIGTSSILHDVTFTVPRNDVTVVVGRNGVGKTTTLRSILGLNVTTGVIEFDGQDISSMDTHQIVRLGIAYVPEDRDVFKGLTVAENLRLAERPTSPHRYDLVHDLFPELKTRSRQLAGSLSGGQQQMLSLARGLLNVNALMLIDEPTKGLAPRVVSEVVEVLKRASEVSTMVMVEQNLAVAKTLAGHVVAMTEGRVAVEGSPDILNDDAKVTSLLHVSRQERGE